MKTIVLCISGMLCTPDGPLWDPIIAKVCAYLMQQCDNAPQDSFEIVGVPMAGCGARASPPLAEGSPPESGKYDQFLAKGKPWFGRYKEETDLFMDFFLKAFEPLTGSQPIRVVLVGHSKGGTVALLAAPLLRELPWVQVLGIVSLSSRFDFTSESGIFTRFTKEQLASPAFLWEPKNLKASRGVGIEITREEISERKRVDVAGALNSLSGEVPLLFVHGDADTVVPFSDLDLHLAAAAKARNSHDEPRRVAIAGGDHSYRDKEELVADHVVSFLSTLIS